MSEKPNPESDTKMTANQTIDRRTYLRLVGATGTGLVGGFGSESLGEGFAMPARAASTIIDDFSDENIGNRYKYYRSNATTSVTSVQTAVTSNADRNVLEITGDSSASLYALKDDGDTNLNAYPDIGETFSYWLRGLDGTEVINFSYGVQDGENRYYVQLNLDSAHMGLFKYVNGSGESLAGDWSNATIQNNTNWFKVEVQWTTSHEHTISLYQNGSEVTSVSYTEGSGDPQFTATGVGYAGYLGSGGTVQFDYAILDTGSEDSEPTVIEDFERDSPLQDYSGDKSQYTISTDSSAVIESTKTLKATGDYGGLGTSSENTLRGYEYRCQVKLGDSSAEPGLLTCVQNTESPIQNCYWSRINTSRGQISIGVMTDGTYSSLANEALPSIETGKIYELGVRMGEEKIKTIVHEPDSGQVLAETAAVTDTTWTDGQLGFYTGGEGGYPAFYDSVRKGSLSDSPMETEIDDFEGGDLTPYIHDPTQANSSAKIGAYADGYPTYSGSHTLAIEDTNTEMISLPGDGLKNYPSAGDTFICWLRTTAGDANANFTYGVQDHENRYFVKVNFDLNAIYLFKYENDAGTVLASDSDLSLETDAWYKILVEWESDGTHRVHLVHQNGNYLTSVSSVDTTWKQGGIGFDGYMSTGGSVYFDNVSIYRAPGGGTSYMIDLFADGDLEEYETNAGGDMDTTVEVVDESGGPVFRGEYALKLGRPSGESSAPGRVMTYPGDTDELQNNELPFYPQPDDPFSVMMYAPSYARPVVYYGANDSNRFWFQINDDNSGVNYALARQEKIDGVWETVEGTSKNESPEDPHFNGEWYEIQIDWQRDGTHNISVYEWNGHQELDGKEQIGSLSAEMTPVDGRGFGLKSGRQPAVHFDNLFKQSGNEGYPINHQIGSRGLAVSAPGQRIDYTTTTELIEARPDTQERMEDWGITFEIGHWSESFDPSTEETEDTIMSQEIEVEYYASDTTTVRDPQETEKYGAMNYSGGTGEARAVPEGIVDWTTDVFVGTLGDAVEFINLVGVAGRTSSSFRVVWDYEGQTNEMKHQAGCGLKFRAILSPGDPISFDVYTKTTFVGGNTAEHSFTWSTYAPLESS
jgi:hypothetical protein